MKPKFKLKIFIYYSLATHILIYLCWSFVKISFVKPFIDFFETEESRINFLTVIFFIMVLGLPFYAPFEKTTKQNLTKH